MGNIESWDHNENEGFGSTNFIEDELQHDTTLHYYMEGDNNNHDTHFEVHENLQTMDPSL